MKRPISGQPRQQHPNRRVLLDKTDLTAFLPESLQGQTVNAEVWYDAGKICLSVAIVGTDGRGLVDKHKIDVKKLVEHFRRLEQEKQSG